MPVCPIRVRFGRQFALFFFPFFCRLSLILLLLLLLLPGVRLHGSVYDKAHTVLFFFDTFEMKISDAFLNLFRAF